MGGELHQNESLPEEEEAYYRRWKCHVLVLYALRIAAEAGLQPRLCCWRCRLLLLLLLLLLILFFRAFGCDNTWSHQKLTPPLPAPQRGTTTEKANPPQVLHLLRRLTTAPHRATGQSVKQLPNEYSSPESDGLGGDVCLCIHGTVPVLLGSAEMVVARSLRG